MCEGHGLKVTSEVHWPWLRQKSGLHLRVEMFCSDVLLIQQHLLSHLLREDESERRCRTNGALTHELKQTHMFNE